MNSDDKIILILQNCHTRARLRRVRLWRKSGYPGFFIVVDSRLKILLRQGYGEQVSGMTCLQLIWTAMQPEHYFTPNRRGCQSPQFFVWDWLLSLQVYEPKHEQRSQDIDRPRHFPAAAAKAIKPMAIPETMLKVSGIMIITRKAGMDSV